MTTIFQRLANVFLEDEAKVVATFIAIRKGAEVALKDIEAGIDWVENNAPAIVSKIQSVEAVILQLAVATNPNIAGAVAEANAAVAALNALVAARASGSSTPQQLVTAYQAFTNADAAAAMAKAAAAATPAT